jgi:hypothetical protein
VVSALDMGGHGSWLRGAGGAVVAYSRATSPAVTAEEVAAQQLPWPGYLSRRAKKSMLAAYGEHE